MDYQSAIAALLQQQSPFSQMPPSPLHQLLGQNNNPSPLPQMFEKQFQQQSPRLFMRELDPGVSWGGRDRNNILPDDVMQSYFSGQQFDEHI